MRYTISLTLFAFAVGLLFAGLAVGDFYPDKTGWFWGLSQATFFWSGVWQLFTVLRDNLKPDRAN